MLKRHSGSVKYLYFSALGSVKSALLVEIIHSGFCFQNGLTWFDLLPSQSPFLFIFVF